MYNYRNKILGKWFNDTISYDFYEDGKMTVNWIKDNVFDTLNWSIENDEIIFKNGINLNQTWKGKINHITDKELSITDLSNQIGTIDLLYKKELTSTTEKKNFKEKLIENKKKLKNEIIPLLVGIPLAIAFFGVCGYTFFNYNSHQYTYFIIGILIFMLSAILLIYTFRDDDKYFVFFLKFYSILFTSVVLMPLLFLVFSIIFAIISHWYFIIVLGVIISIIILLIHHPLEDVDKKRKWLYLSLIILISIASLYFLYDAKSIMKIKFEVYFDNSYYLGF